LSVHACWMLERPSMALATQFVGPVQSEHRGLYCSRRQQEVLLEGLKYKALSFLHSLSDFLSSYFHLLFDTWFPWVEDTGHMQRAPRAAAHLLLCPIPPAHLRPCVLCLSPRWAVEQGISPSHSLTNLSLTLPSPSLTKDRGQPQCRKEAKQGLQGSP
jgi:hypothetical protein